MVSMNNNLQRKPFTPNRRQRSKSSRKLKFPFIKCVVPEDMHISPEGTFVLGPRPPRIFISGGACHIPLPPGNSVIFPLRWVPCGKNISVKNTLTLCFFCHQIDFLETLKSPAMLKSIDKTYAFNV